MSTPPNPHYAHAYLNGTIFFALCWVLVYVLIRRSRPVVWWSSVTLFWVSPIFEWLNADYWHPSFCIPLSVGCLSFGIESLALGFSVIGISAGLFDWLVRRAGHHEVLRIRRTTYVRLLSAGLWAALPILILNRGFGVNSVHAHIYVCFVLAIFVMWRLNKRWHAPSLLTGAALGAVMIVFYFAFFLHLYPNIIAEWWNDKALWGIWVGKVPFEEIAWGAANALYLGPVIRYCMDKSFEHDLDPVIPGTS